MGVTDAMFYRGKRVYAGMGVSEVRRLKQLEGENAKLKRLLADLTLNKPKLRDAPRKNWDSPPLVAKPSRITRMASHDRRG